MSEQRKIICHASGDRCHGCAHYRGEADVCEYAAAPSNDLTELRALVAEMRGYVGPDPDSTIAGWTDELEALIERMDHI